MPYRKRNYKVKRTYRRKYVRKGGVAAKANAALRIAKSIRKGIEYKRLIGDISVPEEIEVKGNTYNLLQGMTRSDGTDGRSGNLVRLARLKYMLHVNFVETAETTVHYRVVVVRGVREGDRGVSMSFHEDQITGVFDDGIGLDKPLWLVKRKADNNIRDTKILFDRTYTLAPGTVTSRAHNFNFKLGWNARFRIPNSVNPNEDVLEDGGVYVMICASEAKLQAQMESVITFTDY